MHEKFQNARLVPPKTSRGVAPPAEAKFTTKTTKNLYGAPNIQFLQGVK